MHQNLRSVVEHGQGDGRYQVLAYVQRVRPEPQNLLNKNRLSGRLQEPRQARTGPGRPSLPDDHYDHVSNLYLEAKIQGGQFAKRPNVYVLAKLREEDNEYLPYGEDQQLSAVRKWVHRARTIGFLPSDDEITAFLRGEPHPRLLNPQGDAPKTTRKREGTKKGQK